MEFDFKITTWERVKCSKANESILLQAIRDGKVTNATEAFQYLNDEEMDCTTLSEVNEPMNLEENGGCSTIEVYYLGEVIYKNGKE